MNFVIRDLSIPAIPQWFGGKDADPTCPLDTTREGDEERCPLDTTREADEEKCPLDTTHQDDEKCPLDTTHSDDQCPKGTRPDDDRPCPLDTTRHEDATETSARAVASLAPHRAELERLMESAGA